MFLLTAATIWTIAAVTPGPNFLVVARCSVGGNRIAGLSAVLGTVCGTLIWGLAGWLGISVLFAAAPALFIGLKLLGGAYILWLGYRLMRSAWRDGPPVDAAHVPKAPTASLTARRAFRLAFLTNIANPKSAIFVTSIFAAALPADHDLLYGIASVAVMMAISSVWYSAVALRLSGRVMGTAYLAARRKVDALAGAAR
ncbi:LysE family transporter, partial [uncultured Paracoccus sp.]|uniref:LysE family transporter n=1 Tax=uncultured Paracoccus sp. TaxID=189685 RepID=UPI0025DBC32C